MRRALIAATIATLAVPVVVATPASADAFDFLTPSTDLAMSADNTASPVPVYFEGSVDCEGGTTSIGPVTLAPGDSRGETPSCEYNSNHTTTFSFTIGTDEMHAAGSDITCTGDVVTYGVSSPHPVAPSVDFGPGHDDRCMGAPSPYSFVGWLPKFVNFARNEARAFNFQLTAAGLPAPAPPSGRVTNSGDVNVDTPDLTPDTATGLQLATTRAKATEGFTTRNPKRVAAMAKRFAAAPGDVINIHAYGPDREVALAKAKHVREQLQAEITRMGGDAGNHAVFVTYAGDPAHKKGVHVTIHQHAGTKHTKAQAWVNTHLASKGSSLTADQQETVTAHLVSSATQDQVQSAWDIDMNQDVSIVDPAEITQIARYFLDHPTQHILIRDHVGSGDHGSTVADAVLAEMARLAAQDGVRMTRGFLDWLNQVVVTINEFTDDINAAEVEIHAVTVAIDEAATSIATLITDGTTLVGDVIKDVETVVNPIVTAIDEGTVVVKTVKDIVMAVAV